MILGFSAASTTTNIHNGASSSTGGATTRTPRHHHHDDGFQHHHNNNNNNNLKKKRNRRRRKPKCRPKVEPLSAATSKKHHDAPMTKRDLYFALECQVVGIGQGASAVARVTMVNWDTEVVLDTCVQVPVPVVDFRDTGIALADVSPTNSQAMSFGIVRQTVEQRLRGKILIGHNLQEHLTALGLSHPYTDVRDSSQFLPFLYEEVDGASHTAILVERSLQDLSIKLLQRHPNGPTELCIAALDLYKDHRKEWEQDLIQRSQKENKQLQYSPASAPPQQTSYNGVQNIAAQSRPRLPSYERPVSMSPMAMAPQTMMAPPEDFQSRTNSSWFTLGRSKARIPQHHEPPPIMNPSPALSSQAMQVLSASYYDHYDSPYESSTYYDASTDYNASSDYGSSAPYDGSSVPSSVPSESVASSVHEELETGFQPQQTQTQPQQESSSWFRFGSRKPRYSSQQQQHVPMMAVQESDEPEELSQSLKLSQSAESLAELQMLDEQARLARYEPPRYYVNQIPSKQSSSWFGFRRSKSPGAGRLSVKELEDATELEDSSELSISHHSSANAVSLAEVSTSTTDTAPNEIGEKQQTPWFSFRKAKRRNSQEEEQVMYQENSTLPTECSEATDEDWLREVMNQPGNNEDLAATQAWMDSKPQTSTEAADETEEGAVEPTAQQQSNWFRISRPSKDSSRSVSRLPSLEDEEEEGVEQSTQSSFDGSNQTKQDNWLEQVVIQAKVDASSSINPAWLDLQRAETPADSSPSFISPPVAEFNPLFSRSRLCTESSIPTVATEEEEEDFSQDFVQGMEQNLSFLNI